MLRTLFGRKKSAHVELKSHGLSFDVPSGQTMLEAALAGGIAFPHNCKVGSCTTCRYRLDSGTVGELSPSALALSKDQLRAGYRLACQALPKSDLVIHLDSLSDAAQTAVDRVPGKIASSAPLTHDIRELVVRLDRPMPYRAGQYAELSVDAVSGARSYSFATPPRGGAGVDLHFYVRRVPGGAFTEWLFGADRSGTSVTVAGPQGAFGLRPHDAPILCIGGGSGLAPLKCILEQALWEGVRRPVTLLFGARTQADLLCLKEIETMARAWPAQFRFIPALSAEPDDSSWGGERGLVADVAARMESLVGHQAYLCGPPPMVDAAEAMLLGFGVPPGAIFADRFFDRGRPAPQPLA